MACIKYKCLDTNSSLYGKIENEDELNVTIKSLKIIKSSTTESFIYRDISHLVLEDEVLYMIPKEKILNEILVVHISFLDNLIYYPGLANIFLIEKIKSDGRINVLIDPILINYFSIRPNLANNSLSMISLKQKDQICVYKNRCIY
jgi:hypothetical protein